MHAAAETQRPLTLDLLRHGEPEGGVRYRGSQDDPLSALGWRQLDAAVAAMQADHLHWDRVICSPLQRCRAFAEQCAARLQLPCAVNTGLRELHFGDLEGLTPEQAWSQHGDLLTRMWQAPESTTPPNGEPFQVFRDRVCQALRDLMAQHSGESLLIITHGGVIRAALNGLFGMSASSTFQMDVPYAGSLRFSVYPGSVRANLQLNWINRYQGSLVR